MMNNRGSNSILNQQEFAQQAKIMCSRPVRAWLSFTSRCNLRCAHCPRSGFGGGPSTESEMLPKLFEQIETELLPFLERCKIGGNNLGEPLLAKNADEYFEKVARHSCHCTLVTNGLALNEHFISSLVTNGWTIDMSTEAATSQTYRAIRGTDYDSFVAALRGCCETKRAIQSDVAKIRICFTAFHDNVAELPGLIEMAANIGVDEIMVTHLIPMRHQQRDQSLVYHKGMANEIFLEAQSQARELGINLLLPPLFPVRSMTADAQPGQKPVGQWCSRRCSHPWTSVSIDEKGDVYPCCLFDEHMGNLHRSSLADIWNNRRYRRLRRTVNSGSPIGQCRDCPLRGNNFTSVECADERALLQRIGPADHIDTRYFLRLKAREILGNAQRTKTMWRSLRTASRKLFP